MRIISEAEILACAEEILRNTKSRFNREMSERFVRFYQKGGEAIYSGDGLGPDDFEDECYDPYWNRKLYVVFREICRGGYDIKGFQLFDVPHGDAFCFWNEEKHEAFDVYTYDAYVGYTGNDSCEHVSDSIREAVEKYNRDCC